MIGKSGNLLSTSEDQIKKFKKSNTEVIMFIDHSLYSHMSKISKDTKNSLIKDFI